MRLQDLQKTFQHYVLGAPDAAAQPEVTSTLLAAIIDAPPLPAAERLGIYRNAYRIRLLEALDDTYPSLHRILGDEAFQSLGEIFIEVHPSVHRSIRWYGRELAQFMAGSPPYDSQPILAEIAQFEWTLSEVFDAADAVPLQPTALRDIHPDVWPQMSFRFHPSVRCLSLSWNTVAVWQSVAREEVPPNPAQIPAEVPWLLWRQDFMNRYRSLDAIEEAALAAAMAGLKFEEICGTLTAWLPEQEIPLRAATLIGAWAHSGIITAC